VRSDSEKGTLRPIYKVSNFTYLISTPDRAERMVDGDTCHARARVSSSVETK
jgi:hypothetical protein